MRSELAFKLLNDLRLLRRQFQTERNQPKRTSQTHSEIILEPHMLQQPVPGSTDLGILPNRIHPQLRSALDPAMDIIITTDLRDGLTQQSQLRPAFLRRMRVHVPHRRLDPLRKVAP